MNKLLAFLAFFAVSISSIYACCRSCPSCPGGNFKVAKAVFYKGTTISQNVSGTITFTSVDGTVQVTGTLTGLSDGKHGFHIHTYGDLTSCSDAAGHFNPLNKNHGAPSASDRHVGDLGNIQVTGGTAVVKKSDQQIALSGDTAIIGRMLVVHKGEDDLGLGGNAESLRTGNAGARVACAVIGLSS